MTCEIYKAPWEMIENLEIKPSDYMVENLGDELEVYRVLTPNEVDDFPDNKIMVNVDGDYIIYVATCNSKEEVELTIQSYWEAIRQLNTK